MTYPKAPARPTAAIVHAGYDAKPGTDKARVNVKGAKMMPALCRQLGIPYGQPGALVIGFDEADRAHLQKLYEQSLVNGVEGCRVIEREEVLRLEPNVNPDVLCALYAPTSGLVSPYELTHQLANAAAYNGVRFQMETQVLDMKPMEGGWLLSTDRGDFQTRAFVICAGVAGAELHNRISSRRLTIIPRRGQYYLMDHEPTLRFSMTSSRCPPPWGKGCW